MAREKPFEKPISPEGCWIKYQLSLCDIKLETVAKKSGLTVATVSRVIFSKRRSKKVESVLAEMLGYKSWQHLWAAAFINARRKAV